MPAWQEDWVWKDALSPLSSSLEREESPWHLISLAALQHVAQLSSASLPPSVKCFSLRCVEKQRDWSSVEVLYESELSAFMVSIWKDGLLACMPQAFQDLLGQVCIFPPWVMPRVFVPEILGPARNLLSPSSEVKGGHTLRKVEKLLVESHSEHFSLKT